ncbi:hypothetical protein [Streptomyces sp. NPDC057002]
MLSPTTWSAFLTHATK